MERTFGIIGAILMFIGVAAGAFGAHGLKPYFERFPELAATFETAVRYHQIHAVALLFMAWAVTKWPNQWSVWAGWLLLAGIVIFSGSLYLLVMTRMKWLGAITPIGGVAFLAGWLCLAVSIWQS